MTKNNNQQFGIQEVLRTINEGEDIEVIRWVTDLLVNKKTVSLFVDGVDTFGLLDYYESIQDELFFTFNGGTVTAHTYKGE